MKEFVVNCIVKFLIFLTLNIDKESRKELQKIPQNGPGLLITNHVSNIEGPVIYSFLQPRRTIALGKVELWDKWPTRLTMEAWECIPIKRGGVDQSAIKACMDTLDKGDFLCIAPEGTRSKDGKMHQGKAGITLFLKPDTPIFPVATWGLENYDSNLKKLKRTTMKIRVGEPYYPTRPSGRFTTEKRQEMVDGIMMKLAELIPEDCRGYYS